MAGRSSGLPQELVPHRCLGGLFLVGSGGFRAERPQAEVLPSGLCPQPQACLVSCWANPGAVTAQGPVGAALLPQPPTAEGERG